MFEFSTLAVRGRIYAELLRTAQPIRSETNAAIVSPVPTHEEIASRIIERKGIERRLRP